MRRPHTDSYDALRREYISGGMVTLDCRCPGCGHPVIVECDKPEDHVMAKRHPDLYRLCFFCVVRVLVRGAIATHGDLGESPQSAQHDGHENRIREHHRRAMEYYETNRDASGAAIFHQHEKKEASK